MTDQRLHRSPYLFAKLLFEAQRVEWRYSMVVILVITGLFSTPLALGSIRHRVYAAVKSQIEKENNAREIRLQLRRASGPSPDEKLVRDLRMKFPKLEVVGNHKLVMTVEGPKSSDFLTLQTLTPGDPRSTSLGIAPAIPNDFGLTDLVVSDGLGEVLYGDEKSWKQLWRTGTFQGAPLHLRINDLPLEPPFRIVARRTLPGRAVYGNPAFGAELRRYTLGFGSKVLSLPLDEALVAASLPPATSSRCLLVWDSDLADCNANAKHRFKKRLADLHFPTPPPPTEYSSVFRGHEILMIGLTESSSENGTRFTERYGDCQEILAPHFQGSCTSATIFPVSQVPVTTGSVQGAPAKVRIASLPNELKEVLPDVERLREIHGEALPSGTLDLTIPEGSGLHIGEPIMLKVEATQVPAQAQTFYRCTDGPACPWFLAPAAVQRLEGLARGSLRLFSTDPVRFVPNYSGNEYDEILAYAPQVEDVEAMQARLAKAYPDYAVEYNAAALEKLRRQDTRLATLFSLTLGLSAIFLLLALGALARINLERRNRQIAQMLILGLSRGFVRRLVVAEYLLLTLLASLAAALLTTILCSAARLLLHRGDAVGANNDFALMLDAMRVDPWAFLLVSALVTACTWVVAMVSAQKAAQTDPVNLLD